MRAILTLLLMLAVVFAGCLEDDGADDTTTTTTDTSTGGMDGNATAALEDRGEYTFDPATGLCQAKDFTDPGDAGQVYYSAIGGGNWAFAETNGIPGLQYENNHPLAGTGAGEDLPVGDDCTNGDQVVA